MQEPHEVVFLNVHETGNLRNVKCVIFHMFHFKIYLMKNETRTVKTQMPGKELPTEHAGRSFHPTLSPPLSPLGLLYAYLVQLLQELESCCNIIVKQYRD